MVYTIPEKIYQYFFILENQTYTRYNISVMIISFEASANIDTEYLGYFSMNYDPELFSDIKENITEISKKEPLSFSLDTKEVKLLFSSYHYLRKMIKIADIESTKFTDTLNIDLDHTSLKEFKKVKLHIDKDYFYFTGYYETSKDKIQFQSLNFDTRFIETLDKQYKNGMVE